MSVICPKPYVHVLQGHYYLKWTWRPYHLLCRRMTICLTLVRYIYTCIYTYIHTQIHAYVYSTYIHIYTISGGRVSRGDVMQALRQGVQRAEGTSQLQDWNLERKNLESRRQIGEFENGNAEEWRVCSRCQWSAVERTKWNKKWWLYSVLFGRWTGWKRCSNSGA